MKERLGWALFKRNPVANKHMKMFNAIPNREVQNKIKLISTVKTYWLKLQSGNIKCG